MVNLILVIIYFIVYASGFLIPAYIVGAYLLFVNTVHLVLAEDRVTKLLVAVPPPLLFSLASNSKFSGFFTGVAVSAFLMCLINLLKTIEARRVRAGSSTEIPPDILSMLTDEPKGIYADENTRRKVGLLVQEIDDLYKTWDASGDDELLPQIENKKRALRAILDPMTLALLRRMNPRLVD